MACAVGATGMLSGYLQGVMRMRGFMGQCIGFAARAQNNSARGFRGSLKMHSSLPAPTKAESRRIEIIKREVGCIACRKEGMNCVPADAHHILSGGKRMGHLYTIPLCRPHHNAVDAPWFEAQFGSQMELLAETNALVARHERMVA